MIVKAAFITPLDIELVDDNTWKLKSSLRYLSVVGGCEIEVPAGFETDFASVPRLPITYALFGGVAQKAAVVHDYLYTQTKVERSFADDIFLEAMEASGISWWRRYCMWSAVRLFGWLCKD